MSKYTKQVYSGFTLVELLVVIAIIGILATLTAGGVKSAQGKARLIGCAANLKEIGRANVSYMQENTFEIVPGNTGSPPMNWYHYLRPYTSGADASRKRIGDQYQSFICPADPSRGGEAKYHADDVRSYAINIETLNFSRIYGRRPRILDVDNTAQTILAADSDIASFNSNWIGPDPANFQKFPKERHDGKANAVMLDGHVEAFEIEDLAQNGRYADYWLIKKGAALSP